MRDLVEHLLGPLLGYVIAYLVRYLQRFRFWRRVEESAKAKIEDDRVPISDPREAVEQALIEVQRQPVERAARAVRSSVPPPHAPTIAPARAGSHSELDRDPGKSG
jgi:hypothetical protein